MAHSCSGVTQRRPGRRHRSLAIQRVVTTEVMPATENGRTKVDSHLQALSSGTVPVSDSDIGALRGALRGSVLLPGEPGYDAARAIWNAMIDRHPGMIVQALGAADVIRAVNFAREHGVALAVRGG